MDSAQIYILMALMFLMLGLASDCEAEGDLRIGGFLASEHHNKDRDYNEKRIRSLFACYDGWCAGRYENSFSELDNEDRAYSDFIAHEWQLGKAGPFKSSATFGIANGYEGFSGDDDFKLWASLNIKYGYLKGWQVGKVSLLGWETKNLLRNR